MLVLINKYIHRYPIPKPKTMQINESYRCFPSINIHTDPAESWGEIRCLLFPSHHTLGVSTESAAEWRAETSPWHGRVASCRWEIWDGECGSTGRELCVFQHLGSLVCGLPNFDLHQFCCKVSCGPSLLPHLN